MNRARGSCDVAQFATAVILRGIHTRFLPYCRAHITNKQLGNLNEGGLKLCFYVRRQSKVAFLSYSIVLRFYTEVLHVGKRLAAHCGVGDEVCVKTK